MSVEEFGRHYHYILFKNACHERKGAAFQTFFEQIMMKHDASFIAVKPAGREGDWKCDGFSSGSGTVYQCYAPEGMKSAKAAAKVKEDFAGARVYWKKEMMTWIFVWSAHEALPPQVLKALTDVRAQKHSVTIDDWSREHLWNIVKGFPEEVRTDLLGAKPLPFGTAVDTTAAEIKVLLRFLAGQAASPDTDNLDLTEIAEKLRKNNLSYSVEALVTPSIPIARMVDDYLARQPDSEYSARSAQALIQEYQRIVADRSLTDPDQVFWGLVRYTASYDLSDHRKLWAALGIVTHYFELCDVFER